MSLIALACGACAAPSTIARVDGTAIARADIDATVPEELIARGEREFFSTASDQTFTFVVDADGRVTAMIAHVGKDLELRRLP